MSPVSSGGAEREQHDRPVEANLIEARQVGGLRGDQRFGPPVGERQSERAADEAEHDRFGDQLADQARAAGAEGRAHRELAVSRRAAREQQVGDVRAGHEQHESNRAQQHQQRPLDVADHQVAQRRAREGQAAVHLRKLVLQPRANPLQIGIEIGRGDAPASAANRGEKLRAARRGRGGVEPGIEFERRKDLGLVRERRLWSQHADDGAAAGR